MHLQLLNTKLNMENNCIETTFKLLHVDLLISWRQWHCQIDERRGIAAEWKKIPSYHYNPLGDVYWLAGNAAVYFVIQTFTTGNLQLWKGLDLRPWFSWNAGDGPFSLEVLGLDAGGRLGEAGRFSNSWWKIWGNPAAYKMTIHLYFQTVEEKIVRFSSKMGLMFRRLFSHHHCLLFAQLYCWFCMSKALLYILAIALILFLLPQNMGLGLILHSPLEQEKYKSTSGVIRILFTCAGEIFQTSNSETFVLALTMNKKNRGVPQVLWTAPKLLVAFTNSANSLLYKWIYPMQRITWHGFISFYICF